MREGWEIKNWGEVIEIRSGRNQKAVLDPNGKYPILGSAGKVMGYANDFLCEEGTTIIGRKGTIDNPLFIESKFWNVDTAFGLIAGEVLDKRYLFYFCLSYDFVSLDKGTTLPSLVKKDLVKIPIPIPPLPEQKRIVEILDEAFEAIDQAKANIEKNIQNAEELFQSKLNEIFTQKGEGWEEKRLDSITEVKDGTHDSPKYVTKGIPFVTQKNVTVNGLSFEDTKYISKETHDEFYKRSNVANGDILISMIGANRGMACLVDDERVFSIKNVGLIKNSANYSPGYLLYYFKSPIGKKYISENSSGSAQGFIALGKLRSFPILLPAINIQVELEEYLFSIDDGVKSWIDKYKVKLHNLEELKKSILQKAFSGELTANEELVV